MRRVSAEDLDAILPQTQCGLCGHGACMPYAKAMLEENAPINLCPPGGVDTLIQLGELLQQDPAPFIDDMLQKSKPQPLAFIRENECIGCTKCIQACPVDAILGSAKQMHTVIAAECTGCELCVPVCPVDCIDLLIAPTAVPTEKNIKADHARKRYQARSKRLSEQKKAADTAATTLSLSAKKQYIAAAIARAKAKKANGD